MPLPNDAGLGPGGSDGGNCTPSEHAIERIDVDLLFLVDASISMAEQVAGGQTRFEALRTAFEQLADAPELAELQAGIQFYSLSGAANDSIDCNAANYATPAVGIGLLSDVGDDVVAAMASRSPGGLTPIAPALQGSLQYASQWAQAHPERGTAVVLFTDSYPTQCSSDPTAVSALARSGFANTPSIRTFVVGIGANSGARFNLENIARAGGTQTPVLVDDGRLAQGVVDAVLNIAASNLACDFAIPPPPSGQQVSSDRVRIVYTEASTGEAEEVPRVASSAACAQAANGGFYYDVPANPTRIHLCPCTCSRLGGGRAVLRFACAPPLP